MTTERYVEEWRTAGIITEDQCSALLEIVRKQRFSVFLELNALLYLGVVAFVHQTWDPMLLGVLLVGVAVVVRRWLARGPGDGRHGYTATRILQTDRDVLSTVANVSVAWPRDVNRPETSTGTAPSAFDGGRSGGGGASY